MTAYQTKEDEEKDELRHTLFTLQLANELHNKKIQKLEETVRKLVYLT